MGMVSGKAALRAGSQRLVLRVGVVAEWPSDDPCDDVNRVPSCAMLVVSLYAGHAGHFIIHHWHGSTITHIMAQNEYGTPATRVGRRGAGVPERGVPECRRAGIPERRNAEAVYGCRPAQAGHARTSFLLLRRSTTSAESATRLECVTTITHLPI